jgi:putative nucleotidyltransferase with HDIG domain
LALLDIEPNVNDMGRRHSKAVANVALQIARALNSARAPEERLNLRLVESAGLLHDIAKGLDDHEQEGGRMLTDMGYERVGRVVAAHRDIDLQDHAALTEREVVYFADKLVRGDRLVTVRERFEAKMAEYAHVPGAVEAIGGRMQRALMVQAEIESEIGAPLDAVVRGDVLPEAGGGR